MTTDVPVQTGAAGSIDVRLLAQTTRGGQRESAHLGAAAVCDPSGHLRARIGDPDLVTFLRSTAKPLQVLPFLESGAAAAWGATDVDLALACASHAGSARHRSAVVEFQQRVGVPMARLQCGTHAPFDREAAAELKRIGNDPTPNHHNCSGKHTAMLATAHHLGEPLTGYLEPTHPVQKRILTAVSAMSGVAEGAIGVATDGCSAPNFALPLRAVAGAFARLADPSDQPAARQNALARVFESMTQNPFFVAGGGRFDTVVMEACAGKVLSKFGAEGVLGLALRRSDGLALGAAVKLIDGDPETRALPLVGLELLRQLGGLDEASAQQLAAGFEPELKSHRGAVVGALEAGFELEWVA